MQESPDSKQFEEKHPAAERRIMKLLLSYFLILNFFVFPFALKAEDNIFDIFIDKYEDTKDFECVDISQFELYLLYFLSYFVPVEGMSIARKILWEVDGIKIVNCTENIFNSNN